MINSTRVVFIIKCFKVIFCVILMSGCAHNKINDENIANGTFKETLSRITPSILSKKGQDYKIDKKKMVIYPNGVEKKREYIYKPKFLCDSDNINVKFEDVELINLNLIESDIREALIELSMISGVSIILDEEVEGIVTANILNKSILDALKIILMTTENDFKVKDDYILVSNNSADNPNLHEISESCAYQPQNLSSFEIIELMPKYYRDYITFSKTSRYLNIIASKKIMKEIKRQITQLDYPPQQVHIEVNIVEVGSNALRTMGIDWGQLMFIDSNRINATNIDIINTNLVDTLEVSTMINEVTNPYITFLSAIKLLADKGMASIKAMPSIVTLDGNKANFSSTQTIWFTPIVNSITNTKTYELDYGVELEIIPRVSHQGMINLEIINAGVSDLTHSGRNTSPKLITHKLSNNVRIGDGETLVLGGLIQKKQYMSNTKVPGLSDIPLAGNLFQQDSNGSYTSEVLIVITPRILE